MAKDIIKTSQIAHRILLEPWITEEATRVAELNKYIFIVAKSATKEEIRRAVEETYKVKVVAVNTINIPAKKRIRGATVGWKSGYKKAVVSLKEGKIEFFEGK